MSEQPFLRVVHGRPEPEEVAALACALMALREQGERTGRDAGPPPAVWRRQERMPGFPAPGSWSSPVDAAVGW
jgi:acyl-CoA carboxylase epsilon subunit-like protein